MVGPMELERVGDQHPSSPVARGRWRSASRRQWCGEMSAGRQIISGGVGKQPAAQRGFPPTGTCSLSYLVQRMIALVASPDRPRWNPAAVVPGAESEKPGEVS